MRITRVVVARMRSASEPESQMQNQISHEHVGELWRNEHRNRHRNIHVPGDLDDAIAPLMP